MKKNANTRIQKAVEDFQTAGSSEERERAFRELWDAGLGHNVHHYASILYNAYGKKEMDSRSIDMDDVVQWLSEEALILLSRKRIEGSVKQMMAFIGKTITNHTKHHIEGANGVTRHYAAYLLRLKKQKVDLWTAPHEEIICALNSIRPDHPIKNPERVIRRLQDMFSIENVSRDTVKEDFRYTDDGGLDYVIMTADGRNEYLADVLCDRISRSGSDNILRLYSLLAKGHCSQRQIRKYAKAAGLSADEAEEAWSTIVYALKQWQ